VRSYALDAIEAPQQTAPSPACRGSNIKSPSPLAGQGRDGGTLALVRKFLDDMQAAALERFPALGEGEDLRIERDAVAGGALYAGNHVVHLCSFPAEPPRQSLPSPLAGEGPGMRGH